MGVWVWMAKLKPQAVTVTVKRKALNCPIIHRVHVEQSADGRGLDLVFRSIESGDDGEYSCEANIDGKDEHQYFRLNVIGKF